MITTINISLPGTMYADAKKVVAKNKYASISELFRDALRRLLYPNLTVNGFTPEFEEEVLRRANDPKNEVFEWDGKTPFTDFILSHPPKLKSK